MLVLPELAWQWSEARDASVGTTRSRGRTVPGFPAAPRLFPMASSATVSHRSHTLTPAIHQEMSPFWQALTPHPQDRVFAPLGTLPLKPPPAPHRAPQNPTAQQRFSPRLPRYLAQRAGARSEVQRAGRTVIFWPFLCVYGHIVWMQICK
jgi:hypothetical protein